MPEEIWSSIFGVVIAQVVGQNALDGMSVYGIVLDPEQPPIYLTEETAWRLVNLLEEAFERKESLD